jgi:hypothetical protein
MPWVGFEPMMPAFEWAKTVHALDRAATVIGSINYIARYNYYWAQLRTTPWCMEKWRLSSTILDKGTLWKCVVSPQYPLYRRLGRPQSRYGRCGEEENLLALPGIKHRFFGSTIRSVVAIPIELSRLHAEGFIHQIKLFSRRLNVMKPSREISRVNIGWISNLSEAVSHEIWLIPQDDFITRD